MIRVEPFHPIDIGLIKYQEEQVTVSGFFTIELGLNLKKSGECFSIFADGDIIACCGVSDYWENRCQLWAVIGVNAKKHFISIHKAVIKYINDLDCKRIECAVSVNQLSAIKWVEMLGFKREGLAMCYMPDGRDCYLYSIVRA